MLKSVSTMHVLNAVKEAQARREVPLSRQTQEIDSIAVTLVHSVVEGLLALGFVVAKDVPEEPEPMADLTALTLTGLSDDELFVATTRAIQRAAQGEANGGDEPTYTIAMDHLAESDRRLAAQGHNKRCRTGIYSQAYAAARLLHSGDRTPRTLACNCGATGA
jgi:hypothetical protein